MVFFEPMNPPIAPSSPELTKFYRERYNWRNAGEERMRFRKHMQLAQVRPGSAVLDIGSRNGDLRNYLPRDVKYQGLDIAPEFAAPQILIHDITSGLPFPGASFDYVFMIEVLEHTPTAYSTAGEIHRVLRPGGVWLWAVQGLVTLAVVAFVARSIARNWTEFRSLHVTLHVAPAWIAASVLVVLVTYGMQIESWRRILAGWGQRIAFGPAARTWSLANLGRYVPGKVWSVAGLVVLAQRAGVQMAPAAASAFVSQALAVGTGAAVVAAVTPHATSPLRLAAAGLAALATVGVLTWAPTARWLGRLAGTAPPPQPLPPTAGGPSADPPPPRLGPPRAA